MELKENQKEVVKKGNLVIKKDKKDGYLKTMESLVYYALNDSRAITLIDNSNVYIPNSDIRLLLNEIIAYYNRYSTINEADFYTYLNQNNSDLVGVLKKILSNNYPDMDMETVNESLLAIKKYNIALEIKKLEKEIKEENDIDRQMKLMEEIRFLKTKEGKSW